MTLHYITLHTLLTGTVS